MIELMVLTTDETRRVRKMDLLKKVGNCLGVLWWGFSVDGPRDRPECWSKCIDRLHSLRRRMYRPTLTAQVLIALPFPSRRHV